MTILLVITLRYFLFTPFRIPSGSMMPTLMIGDFILVQKFSYSSTLPFIGGNEPQRGDIVVFQNEKGGQMYYIKRVVGMPGDALFVDRQGVVFINGKAQKETEIQDTAPFQEILDTYDRYSLAFFTTNTGQYRHIIQKNRDNPYRLEYNEIDIPEGHYFVMGDNRDFSHDSRFWGLLKKESIEGKAVIVWLSMTMPWEQENVVFRPERIGKPIR